VVPFKFKTRAKGTPRKPGHMNGLEKRMAEELRLLQIAGKVDWFAYERITLKLADDTRYTPDFAVMLADGTLEMWEVKGFWRDDARVKIKVAAEQFVYIFRAFTPKPKRDGGGWDVETFGGHE
jgi:hypothetical protein